MSEEAAFVELLGDEVHAPKEMVGVAGHVELAVGVSEAVGMSS